VGGTVEVGVGVLVKVDAGVLERPRVAVAVPAVPGVLVEVGVPVAEGVGGIGVGVPVADGVEVGRGVGTGPLPQGEARPLAA
jgi:hypothetical protein